jgi:hypothetical protein
MAKMALSFADHAARWGMTIRARPRFGSLVIEAESRPLSMS